ncbi:hypothetical protein, partial [Salmonella sp. s51228]|uniref:hypothetical protein n=1 Tax=Salmonella sp. s51228 TaxID=3159652 RepID=UPI00397FFA12
ITDESIISNNQKSGNNEINHLQFQQIIEQIPINITDVEMTTVHSKHISNENSIVTNQLPATVKHTFLQTLSEIYTEIIRTEFPIKTIHLSPGDKLINELDYYSRQIANREWNTLTNEEGV